MAQGVTQKPAYAAWLTITNRELAKADKMSAVNTGIAPQSGLNLDDAEHARQTFALTPGEQLLNGISFTSSNATQQLKGLGGTVVQRVLATHYEPQQACALYHLLLSANQWQQIVKETTNA